MEVCVWKNTHAHNSDTLGVKLDGGWGGAMASIQEQKDAEGTRTVKSKCIHLSV